MRVHGAGAGGMVAGSGEGAGEGGEEHGGAAGGGDGNRWNMDGTRRERRMREEKCVQELFEEQVEKVGEATAVDA